MGNRQLQQLRSPMRQYSNAFDATDVPDHVWIHILEFLPGHFVGKIVSRVSRRFYELSNDNSLWKSKCEVAYGASKLHRDDNHSLNWKQRYIEEMFLQHKGSMKWSQPRIWVKPPARSRHTMNAVYNSKLILIGGRAGENLFQFDLKTKSFSSLEILNGEAPSHLSNHSAVSYNDKIYIFGGIGEHNIKNNVLYELDVEQSTWRIVNAQGQAPRARSDHAACLLGCKMYIIGGSSQTVTALNDVHCFNLDTLQWEELHTTTEEKPCGRSGHSIATVENQIFLFGGGVWDREHHSWVQKFNDLYCLNTDSLVWKKLETNGVVPATSKYASVFSIDRYIVVAGGASLYDDEVTADTYVLDTVTLTWKKAPAQLTGKVDSASICLCGDRAYMFGGYCRGDKDTFSVLDLNWKKKSNKFSPIRHSHSAPTFSTATNHIRSISSPLRRLASTLTQQQHNISSSSSSLLLDMN